MGLVAWVSAGSDVERMEERGRCGVEGVGVGFGGMGGGGLRGGGSRGGIWGWVGMCSLCADVRVTDCCVDDSFGSGVRLRRCAWRSMMVDG